MQAWLRSALAGLLGVLSVASLTAPAARAEDWPAILPEELSMSSVPAAPGAPAVYLYRQIDRDDSDFSEKVYVRLKILTDEGRKYGDVEIRYIKYYEAIRGLEARTIRPDGSVVKFSGTVYEKPIVSGRAAKFVAKTFSLAEIQPGCIIEYRYRHDHPPGLVFNSRWILSADLFTRSARFSLTPYPYFTLRWSWPNGLPPGTEQPHKEGGNIRLTIHDLPAFVTEEHMPPEDELRYRVDFIYSTDRWLEKDPAVFWKSFGKQAYRVVERFSDRRSAMTQAVAQITQPGDAPEAKLRKIYARAQQIRNLSYERARSEQERERDPNKAQDAEDVWKGNRGSAVQITWIFLALARAAGLQADPVLVSTRDEHFFKPELMNASLLNSNLVLVSLGGQELYLDPGIPFTPFGQLPWNETDCRALRLSADGGSWIKTPTPEASGARITRKATLKLASGTLEGKVIVTYLGLEAAWRRLAERNEDDTERRQFLEDEIQRAIPTGIDVKLTNNPDWGSSDAPLVAEYELRVPGWASAAGRRQLLPVGLFGAEERHEFEHANRIHPIYFDFPYQHVDDINIELLPGWQVERLPEEHNLDLKGAVYRAVAQYDRGTLHLTRDLAINLYATTVKSYPALHKFFQTLRSGDEEQAIIAPGAAATR